MSVTATSDARVITARKGLGEQLRGIWQYRGLLLRLVAKEIKVKYKNSVLGFLWSMLNPALYLGVFYVVFQVVLKGGLPYYAIFLLSGLLAWNLFSTAVSSATSSITSNAGLVGKVYFPREVLPLASVGAALVHFVLQSVVLLIVLGVMRYDVSWKHSLSIAPALLILIVLAAGVGLLLAALNVYLRDVEHLVELALLAWFWLTPIIYPYFLVADRLEGTGYAWIRWLNPLVPIVLAFQRGIYNVVSAVGAEAVGARPLSAGSGAVTRILPTDMDLVWYVTHLGGVAVAAVAVLFLGLVVFGRLEGNFAEEL